jgi:EAL domain-containing protein (putative c-di-GMP-specific phosphodiesterase class I)
VTTAPRSPGKITDRWNSIACHNTYEILRLPGGGYSAAGSLAGFPFDKIKIDRSIAQGAAYRRDCSAVVASVLALSRGLGIAATAKGVESRQQFEALLAAGVDYAQGYLFAKPVPHCEFDLDSVAQSMRNVA